METLPESKAPAVVKKRKYNYTVKTGRPTKYKPEYCEMILEYFDREPYHERVVEEETQFYANGAEKSSFRKTQLVANRMPTLYRFARSIGVNQDTLHEWSRRHPEFAEAMKNAKELQKEFLIDAGMAGASNPAVTIFTAKNVTDMRDKVEPVQVEHQVFFIPKEIAAKHNLQLPEGQVEPVKVEATVLPPKEDA